MPESPPIRNIAMKPITQSIGVVKWILPSHSVATHEKILMPVGTASRSVVTIIGTRSQGAIPATNMWCAQTEKPSTRIASRLSGHQAVAEDRFSAITATTSLMIPKPGSIMMYTAGWE